ncbi:MAG: hypothetical protein EAX96_01525 [Candidatus Lokiarchaeota archaeon]|nr:hypothetical protein [Candidatus Lokiarchaeota archaeon]
MSEDNINDEDLSKELEDEIKEEWTAIDDEGKLKSFFPLRLDFFTFIFIIFFIIAVAMVNIFYALNPNTGVDFYQSFLNLIRLPIGIGLMSNVYAFIVPAPPGFEALYISASFVLTFFTLSLLVKNEKFKTKLFESSNKRILLQIAVFFILLIAFMHLIKLLTGLLPDFGYEAIPMIMLSAGASGWLILQSWAILTAARRSATNVEGFFSSHKNKFSYLIVILMPFMVAAFIFLLSFGYLLILHFVQVNFGIGGLFWEILIEVTLFATLLLCIVPLIMALTSENRREKNYENLVVIMTNFFMYPYILFNFTILFFLNPNTIEQLKALFGAGDAGVSQFSLLLISLELAFTLIMLIAAMRTVGKRTNYKLGILNKYGFILAVYAAISGQFGIRYLQIRGQLLVSSTNAIQQALAEYLINIQHLFINIGVIIAIAIALFMFRRKGFGVMYRVHDEISKEDLKRVEWIYDYLKKEYIRKAEMLNLLEMYDVISKILKLNEYEIIRLVNRADLKYKDMKIEGLKKRYVYFYLEQTMEQN